MKHLDELKEILCRELEKYAKSGDITVNSLEKIHKLTDTIKNIDKIETLEKGSGYSGLNPYYEDMGDSYSSRGKHYVRGHYSRDHSDIEYPERYGRRYSKDDAKDHMMSMLGEMMEDAGPKEREALKKCMRAIEES